MTKTIECAQPPWLDPGTLVRRVEDERLGVVKEVETGYFGTLHRVRLLDGSEHELAREDLLVARDIDIVEDVMES